MKRNIRILERILLIGVLMGLGTMSVCCVVADNSGVISSAPGFHPGLFTNGQGNTGIPAVVNTYDGEGNSKIFSQGGNISFSIFPGDIRQGKSPSMIGFLSDGNLREPVNIFGRTTAQESYQYLTTVLPDEQGIFVWEIPEICYVFTDFQVKTT